MYRNFKVATKSRNYQSSSGDGSYIDCIGIFILFMRVTGWHGLFPSWEGLGVGSLGREISVNPVRKFGRGFKPLPHGIFSKLRPFGRSLLSNGVNISRITDLPTPYPLPGGDFLTVIHFCFCSKLLCAAFILPEIYGCNSC